MAVERPVAIITGVSSGIGLAAAKRFVDGGWIVVGTIRGDDRPKALEAVSVDLKRVEMESAEDIGRLVEQTMRTYGRIDAVVANAGYAEAGPLEELSYQDLQQQFTVNVLAVAELVRQCLPHMRAARRGVVVGMSSIAGLIGLPGYSIYSASKFAVEGLLESLYYEVREHNLKVRLIEPSAVNTKFWKNQHRPARRRYGYRSVRAAVSRTVSRSQWGLKPEAVADVIWRSVRSRSRRLHWPVGVTSPVVLARHILPDLLFRRWVRKFMLP